MLATGALAISPLMPGSASAAQQCSNENLPAWGDLKAFVSAQGGGDVGVRLCVTTTSDQGDLVQEWGNGTAYWRRSSGFTVFTNGGTHWAVCPLTDPGTQSNGMPLPIAEPAHHCSPTGSDGRSPDGYMWSSADIDPPQGLQTIGQQKQAAAEAANPYKDWSVEQLRARLADLQREVDSLSATAQCGVFQLGDSYADYRACVQQNRVANVTQERALQSEMVQINLELRRRSFPSM
jgi:hypothetical protein